MFEKQSLQACGPTGEEFSLNSLSNRAESGDYKGNSADIPTPTASSQGYIKVHFALATAAVYSWPARIS